MITNGAKSSRVGVAEVPVRSQASLKQQAYLELKRRILSGKLLPGMVLSERQLATELAMSKTPVHAVLERLEADGLVSVAAQQGIVVREVSPRDLADHFEIREALEPFVVSKLAGRLAPEQKRRLERNLHESRRVVRIGDVEANVRLDAQFHDLLCEFFGNREIMRVMSQIREKVHIAIYQLSLGKPKRMDESLAEHQGIADAVFSGDAKSAAERMKRIFATACNAFTIVTNDWLPPVLTTCAGPRNEAQTGSAAGQTICLLALGFMESPFRAKSESPRRFAMSRVLIGR